MRPMGSLSAGIQRTNPLLEVWLHDRLVKRVEGRPAIPKTASEAMASCRVAHPSPQSTDSGSNILPAERLSPSPFVGQNPAISPSDPLPKEIGLGFWERLWCSTRASYDDLDAHHVQLHAVLQRREVALQIADRRIAELEQVKYRLSYAEERLTLVERLCHEHLGCPDIDRALEHHGLWEEGLMTTSLIAESDAADDGMENEQDESLGDTDDERMEDVE
ncbi:hypothetical protein BV25DRAFT_1843487 [Artomyces pyxidatus]|uniref:Uncharacterized protein n=1 Tax=Artomyces pyxidatus TaxID=48021 RepID=A0ACB8SEJ0_9AGAM|nr:hypothetical protein BV25DRAFT_1843487 [Artomyces pyxidatus]